MLEDLIVSSGQNWSISEKIDQTMLATVEIISASYNSAVLRPEKRFIVEIKPTIKVRIPPEMKMLSPYLSQRPDLSKTSEYIISVFCKLFA